MLTVSVLKFLVPIWSSQCTCSFRQTWEKASLLSRPSDHWECCDEGVCASLCPHEELMPSVITDKRSTYGISFSSAYRDSLYRTITISSLYVYTYNNLTANAFIAIRKEGVLSTLLDELLPDTNTAM